MSFGSLLNVARSAISAHQLAIQTVSHNIANVETEGYSRQRAEITTRRPLLYPFGIVGTGVEVNSVVRLRDQYLDATFRSDVGTRDSFRMRQELMSEIEQVMAEPSETGLASTLDRLWNAWSDLSNNPASATAQSVVRQRGAQVANTLNSYATRLDDLVNRSRDRLNLAVGTVNTLAKQFAALNVEITAAEVSGQQSPDLRDARDLIADELATIAGVRIEMQKNGSESVYLGTSTLVDAGNARTLEVRSTGTGLGLGFVGSPDTLIGIGGTLATTTEFVNTEIPAIRQRLDLFTRGLVNGINEYHASGWTAAGDALGNSNWIPANGPTGSRVNFFEAGFTASGTIRLSAEVLADAGVIASGDVQNAPGNNVIALALAALRDDRGMAALEARMGGNFATQIGFTTGISYGDHYAETVTSVGVEVSAAGSKYQVYETLAQQSDNRRSSVNGVSLDEELTRMIQHQQAYVAATRLVNAADEMAQAILAMV